MTQAIYNIPNQTAAALRLDLNNHLLAIVSQNSGAAAPSVTFAYQFWADTGVTPPMLRQRNAANAAWIAIAQLSNFGLPSVQLQSATAATTTNVGVAYSATQTPPTSGAKLVDATINADNSGALSTLALNGDAAKSIKQYSSTGTKIAAVLVAGMRATLMDDGTDWILMNPLPGGAAAGVNVDILWLNALKGINTGQIAGMRNAVINGNGLIQQRTAPTLTAALQYGVADRHLIGVTGATGVSGTVGVLTNAGFSCGVGYGAIAASWTAGQFIHKHRIEAANTKSFNSKTVTVSGKLYQDTGGSRNFTVSIGKPTTTADTFSAVTDLGTSSAVAVASGTVTSFSYTLALGSTDASLGLEVLITDNAANTVASKNYAVSDLQVEIGSVATVFEQRPYGLELALCERYYQRFTGVTDSAICPIAVWSGTTNFGVLKLKTTMYAAPTLTTSRAAALTCLVNTAASVTTNISLASATSDAIQLQVVSTSSLTTAGAGWCKLTAGTDWLAFSSEL